MPEDVQADPTDPGTLRPKVKPLQKKGTQFQPMEIDEFDLEIHLPEDCSPAGPYLYSEQLL